METAAVAEAVTVAETVPVEMAVEVAVAWVAATAIAAMVLVEETAFAAEREVATATAMVAEAPAVVATV